MQQTTIKKYYQIHSWVGVITGILLFVICITGAISVFGRPELKVWSNPVLRQDVHITSEDIERRVLESAAKVGPAYMERVAITPPGITGSPALELLFEGEFDTPEGGHEHRYHRFVYDPHSLELIEEVEGDSDTVFGGRSSDMSDFITGFHADLHLGNPVGLMLTGLLGLTLMASIITGIVIHRKILKEFFTFRPYRSLRLLWQDTHKALSVWGMLFHFAIGFTGAFLGLATVMLIPAAAYVSFAGDQDALVELFIAEQPPELSGEPARMQIADILASARTVEGGFDMRSAAILGWGDENARVYVYGQGGAHLGNRTLLYSGSSGDLQADFAEYGRLGGISGPALDTMLSLHFGNFGGIAVKLLWGILGVGTGLVAITGMMLWVERRAYGGEGQLSYTAYKRISRFTCGSCAGLIVACAGLFHAQLLLAVPAATMSFWVGVIFFSVWGLSLLWGLMRPNDYRSTKELLGLAGLLLVLVLPVDMAINGDHPFNIRSSGQLVAVMVNMSIFAVGAGLLWMAVRLPSQRPARTASERGEPVRGYAQSPAPAE